MAHVRTSEDLRIQHEVAFLRAMHDDGAQSTRSHLTRDLGLTRGTASVLATRLTEAELIHETPAPQRMRGRPTGVPGPHPAGPLALAVDIREDGWELAETRLGGEVTTVETHRHEGAATAVFSGIATALRKRIRHRQGRVVAVGIAVAGPVRDGHVFHVPHLDWEPTPVADLLGEPGVTARLANDATLAALAEARRGRLRGAGIALHLYADFDVGGALLVDGNPLDGAHGVAGEFGHMRLTGSDQQCACGARGCWGMEIGANTLLRALGHETGGGRGRAEAQAILEQAVSSESIEAVHALRAHARALGTGIGGLVNALDPHVVCVSDFGVEVLDAAGQIVHNAYESALMNFHRERPPRILATTLGDRGPIIGASELALDTFLTPEGLRGWLAR